MGYRPFGVAAVIAIIGLAPFPALSQDVSGTDSDGGAVQPEPPTGAPAVDAATPTVVAVASIARGSFPKRKHAALRAALKYAVEALEGVTVGTPNDRKAKRLLRRLFRKCKTATLDCVADIGEDGLDNSGKFGLDSNLLAWFDLADRQRFVNNRTFFG